MLLSPGGWCITYPIIIIKTCTSGSEGRKERYRWQVGLRHWLSVKKCSMMIHDQAESCDARFYRINGYLMGLHLRKVVERKRDLAGVFKWLIPPFYVRGPDCCKDTLCRSCE